MKKYKKVTYTLPEDTILEIDIKLLMEQSVGANISKSSIIKDCLLQSFEIFAIELVENDGKPFSDIPKKYKGTIPVTFTLPIAIEETLSWYSQKLGVKKSHLVMSSVEIGLKGR